MRKLRGKRTTAERRKRVWVPSTIGGKLVRLGQRIKSLRVGEQLTAPTVAAALGCDVSHYYAIERGAHPPSLELLFNIARVLGCSEVDLFCAWRRVGKHHVERAQLTHQLICLGDLAAKGESRLRAFRLRMLGK